MRKQIYLILFLVVGVSIGNRIISVLDQQIAEQKKRNELEQLKTEQAIIQSRGLTKEILYKQFIDKWDGRTPLYGIAPEFLKITK